jgi:hypothetical protein
MKKYLINGVEVDEEQFKREFEENTRQSAEDNYDDMLDQTNEEVMICGYSYSPSIALHRVDPIAYRCGLTDYESFLLSDNNYYLEKDGFITINGNDFEVIENEN